MKVEDGSCGCFRRHLGLPNIELKVQSRNLDGAIDSDWHEAIMANKSDKVEAINTDRREEIPYNNCGKSRFFSGSIFRILRMWYY